MADKEKFIKCDCHSEGMLITKFDDEEELYFSYWREGINPIKLSWWIRLKLCWMVLTKGNVYDDQVILNKEKAIELASWILLNVVEPADKEPEMDEAKSKDEAAMLKAVFGTGNLLDQKPLDPALEQDKTDDWGGV
jgi:hypothetical protein